MGRTAVGLTIDAPPRLVPSATRQEPTDDALDLCEAQFDPFGVVAELPASQEGAQRAGRFAVFHLKENLVQAVEALNSPPEFMMGKNLIGGRRPVNKGRLADISIPMTEVAE